MLYLDYGKQDGQWVAEQVWRKSESGGNRILQAFEFRCSGQEPGCDDDCRGIYRMAEGDRYAGGWRAGIQPEVEYGLDA